MSANYQILKNTIVVTTLGGAFQLIALFVPLLIAKYFGASQQVDAYYLALSVPNLLIGIIIGGSLKIVFLPVFIREIQERPETVESFIGQVTAFLLLVSIFLVAAILALLELGLFNFLSDADTVRYVERFIKYSLPLIPLTVLFQLYNAIYNSYQKFALLEIANGVKYSCTLGLLIFLHSEYGLVAAVFGQILGQFLALLLSMVVVANSLKLKLRLNFRFQRKHLGLLHMSSLALGAFVFAKLNAFFLKIIAGFLPAGNISIIAFAEKLSIIPAFIIGSSFSLILTSYWAKLFVDNETQHLRDSFNKTISALSIVLLPMAIALSFLSGPIVDVLFVRGSFDAEMGRITSSVFAIFILQTVPFYFNTVISRVLHINQDLSYLFKFTVAAFFLNTMLMYVLSTQTPLAVLGIPLGLLIARTISVAVNAVHVHRKFIAINCKVQLTNLAKIVSSCLIMIFGIWISRMAMEAGEIRLIPAFALAVDIVVGFLAYLVALRFQSHPEFDTLVKLFTKTMKSLWRQ